MSVSLSINTIQELAFQPISDDKESSNVTENDSSHFDNPSYYEETRPLFTIRNLDSKSLLQEAKSTLKVWKKVATENMELYSDKKVAEDDMNSGYEGPDEDLRQRFDDSIEVIDGLISDIKKSIKTAVNDEPLEDSNKSFIVANLADSFRMEAIIQVRVNNKIKELKIAQLATNPKNIASPKGETNVNKNPVRGAGSCLIDRCIAICKEKKLEKISLVSLVSADKFYMKNKFLPSSPGGCYFSRKIE